MLKHVPLISTSLDSQREHVELSPPQTPHTSSTASPPQTPSQSSTSVPFGVQAQSVHVELSPFKTPH